MNLLGVFAASFVVALTGALMPGPVLMITVARVAARGFLVAPRVVLGHALLECAVVLGLFWGLRPVLARAGVQGTIGVVGGLALLWMALTTIAAVRQGAVHLNLKGGAAGQEGSLLSAGGAGRDIFLGVAASATNPYWFLWWATAGAPLAVAGLRYGVPGLTAFYLGHILGDLAWYAAVGAFVAAGRQSINERLYHRFLVACSLVLVVLALCFAADGFSTLLHPGPSA